MGESIEGKDGSQTDARARLLHAAAAVAGGTAPLAARLGISEVMLGKYVSGVFPLPDPLLLQALDFIEEHRQGFPPPAGLADDGHAGPGTIP